MSKQLITDKELESFRKKDQYKHDRAYVTLKICFLYLAIFGLIVFGLAGIYLLYTYVCNVKVDEIGSIFSRIGGFVVDAFITLGLKSLYDKKFN